jgi:hypothetical protein
MMDGSSVFVSIATSSHFSSWSGKIGVMSIAFRLISRGFEFRTNNDKFEFLHQIEPTEKMTRDFLLAQEECERSETKRYADDVGL